MKFSINSIVSYVVGTTCILFAADLVHGLLGASNTYGDNSSFFPFFLSFSSATISSVLSPLFLTKLSRIDVEFFSTDEGVFLQLCGLLREYFTMHDEFRKES
jgi:hypothetical protein